MFSNHIGVIFSFPHTPALFGHDVYLSEIYTLIIYPKNPSNSKYLKLPQIQGYLTMFINMNT